MRKEKIESSNKKRCTSKNASKGKHFGVMAACLGVMAAVIAKGIQLDKEENANQDNQ